MNNNILEDRLISDLGYDFSDIAKIEFPEKAITELLAYMGKLFGCERVYIFEKNEEGAYDCTDEWVRDQTYEGDDRGFWGIDNPSPEKFDELVSIMGMLTHFVSIQMHKRAVEKRIHKIGNAAVSGLLSSPVRKSMYVKMTELRKEAPLAIAYVGTLVNGDRLPEDAISKKAESILTSLFLEENVFPLHNGEFLIIYQGDEDHEIDHVKKFLELAGNTLKSMNIHMLTGIVATESYEDNFFYLVNQANTNMLRDKRAFRNIFLSKYHMEVPTEEFSILLDIRPKKGSLKVVHQEYADDPISDGPLEESLQVIRNRITPEDHARFDEFVDQVLKGKDTSSDRWENEFKIIRVKHGVETVRFSVVKYIDINGDEVFLCSTL